MPDHKPQGLLCQSCGMPLQKTEDFGTRAGGARSDDYCRHCFRDGAFTEPGLDMRDMIERCAKIMAERGIMPEAEARVVMTDTIPKLKRWFVA